MSELLQLIAEQQFDDRNGHRVWNTFLVRDAGERPERDRGRRHFPKFNSGKKIVARKRHGTLHHYAIVGCRCDRCCGAAEIPPQTLTGRPMRQSARLHVRRVSSGSDA